MDVGQVLGNYRIAGKLGQGGMGTVYLAEHCLLGKKVVIKVLHQRLCSNAEMISRFFNEAKAAATIEHKGIASVFDFGRGSDGSAFIVMEYLQGESLGDHLDRVGRLDIGAATSIARQVASALTAAHAKGIIHRDLKPDNVFLVPDSDMPGGVLAKVLDFGIAKLAAETAGAVVRTQTQALLGTPLYMSPEQCRGAGRVDLRSDIYSLGCMLFHMVCGQPPFVREGLGEVMGAHMYETPPAPTTVEPSIPAELEGVLLATLAKQPEERPQTMEELSNVLERTYRESLGAAAGSPRRTQDSPVLRAPSEASSARRASASAIPPGMGFSPTTLGRAPGEVFVSVPRRRSFVFVPAGIAAAALVAGLVAWRYWPREIPGGGTLLASSSETGKADRNDGKVAFESKTRPDPAMQPSLLPGMVVIKGGALRQGRAKYTHNPYGPRYDVPEHSVKVSSFAIGVTEVTMSEYQEYVGAGKATAPWPPATDLTRFGKLPVVNVGQGDAEAYCRWRFPGGRLPSESEWEWAARGPDGWLYPWGNQFKPECVNGGKGKTGTLTAGGSFPCGDTPSGIRDMSGNAWEWTASHVATYPGGAELHIPSGWRVVRGGSFYQTDPDDLTATVRNFQFTDQPNAYTSFRCAATLEPRPTEGAATTGRNQ
ncbi:MAG: bifunctional serine/threonine-protein kinase/formylglycine-generating enzyme family protein [Pseudomonadota bacterium]